MPDEGIVLVHGLWMNGLDMTLLRKRLKNTGYQTKQFSYPTVRNSPIENAMDLNTFVRNIDLPVIHFVCHSLGGLVIRHLFHDYPKQKPGRIVTLGTPHLPSAAARTLSNYFPGRVILGKSAGKGLLGNVPPWNNSHELGSIAGTLGFGMGTVIPGIPKPNDGTVAVKETKLEHMHDHIVVRVTHMGLLLSKTTAEYTVRFLNTGSFK